MKFPRIDWVIAILFIGLLAAMVATFLIAGGRSLHGYGQHPMQQNSVLNAAC